jgi:hypothetical protein
VIEPQARSREGVVPKPHGYKVCLGTTPRASLRARAALLTQEGVPPAPTAFQQTRALHSFTASMTARFSLRLQQTGGPRSASGRSLKNRPPLRQKALDPCHIFRVPSVITV